MIAFATYLAKRDDSPQSAPRWQQWVLAGVAATIGLAVLITAVIRVAKNRARQSTLATIAAETGGHQLDVLGG